MGLLFGNSNYFETITNTGRDIQGLVPVKKYYIMQRPFTRDKSTNILRIPIQYRKGVNDHTNQIFYIDVIRTGGGMLQPYINNQTDFDLKYITILQQYYNNIYQDKPYYQRDKDFTTVKSGKIADNSFMTLQSFGSSTDTTNNGNDTGNFVLNITIDNHNLNIIGKWYTPFAKDLTTNNNDALNGFITLETIDNYIDLV